MRGGGWRWTEAGGRQSTEHEERIREYSAQCTLVGFAECRLGMATGMAQWARGSTPPPPSALRPGIAMRTCAHVPFSVQVPSKVQVQEPGASSCSSVSAATAAAGSGQGSNERPRAARETQTCREARDVA